MKGCIVFPHRATSGTIHKPTDQKRFLEAAVANSGVGLQEFVSTSMVSGEGGAEREGSESRQSSRRTTSNRITTITKTEEFHGSAGGAEGRNEAIIESRRGGSESSSAGRGLSQKGGQTVSKQVRTIGTQTSKQNNTAPKIPIPKQIKSQLMSAFTSAQNSPPQTSTNGGNPAIENAIMALIMHRISSTPTASSPAARGAASTANVLAMMKSMNPGFVDQYGAMNGGLPDFGGSTMGSTPDMGMLGGVGNNMDTTINAAHRDMFSSTGSSTFQDAHTGASQASVERNPTVTPATTFNSDTGAAANDWRSSSSHSNVETVVTNNMVSNTQGSSVVRLPSVITKTVTSQDTMFDHGTANVDAANSAITVNERIVDPPISTTSNVNIPVVVTERVQQSSSLGNQNNFFADQHTVPTVTTGVGNTDISTADGRSRRVERVSFEEPLVIDSGPAHSSNTVVIKETKTFTSGGHVPTIDGQSFHSEQTVVENQRPLFVGDRTQTVQTHSISNQPVTNGIKIIKTEITSDKSGMSGDGTNTANTVIESKQNNVPNFITNRLQIPSKSVTIERTIDSSGLNNDASAGRVIANDNNVHTSSKTVTITKTTTFGGMNDLPASHINRIESKEGFFTGPDANVQGQAVVSDFSSGQFGSGVQDVQSTGTIDASSVGQNSDLQSGTRNISTFHISSQIVNDGLNNAIIGGQPGIFESSETVNIVRQAEPSTSIITDKTINVASETRGITEPGTLTVFEAPGAGLSQPVGTLTRTETTNFETNSGNNFVAVPESSQISTGVFEAPGGILSQPVGTVIRTERIETTHFNTNSGNNVVTVPESSQSSTGVFKAPGAILSQPVGTVTRIETTNFTSSSGNNAITVPESSQSATGGFEAPGAILSQPVGTVTRIETTNFASSGNNVVAVPESSQSSTSIFEAPGAILSQPVGSVIRTETTNFDANAANNFVAVPESSQSSAGVFEAPGAILSQPVGTVIRTERIETTRFHTNSGNNVATVPESSQSSTGVLTIEPMEPIVGTSSNTASSSLSSSGNVVLTSEPQASFDFSNANTISKSLANGPGSATSNTFNVRQSEAVNMDTVAESIKTTNTGIQTQMNRPVSTSQITHIKTVVNSNSGPRIQSTRNADMSTGSSSSTSSRTSKIATKVYPETTELSGPLAAKIARALQGGKRNEKVLETKSISDGSSTTSRSIVSNPFTNQQNREITSSVVASQPIERVMTVERNTQTISNQPIERVMTVERKTQTIHNSDTNLNSIHIPDMSGSIATAIRSSDSTVVANTTPVSAGFDVVQTSAINNGQKQNIFLLTQNKDMSQNNVFTSEAVSTGTEVVNKNNVVDKGVIFNSVPDIGTVEHTVSKTTVMKTLKPDIFEGLNWNVQDTAKKTKNAVGANIAVSNNIQTGSANLDVTRTNTFGSAPISSQSLNEKEGSMFVQSSFREVSKGQRQSSLQPRLDVPQPGFAAETSVRSNAAKVENRPIVGGNMEVTITVDKIVPPVNTIRSTKTVETVKTTSFGGSKSVPSDNTVILTTNNLQSGSSKTAVKTANLNVTPRPLDLRKTTLGGTVVNFRAVTKKVPTWRQKPFTPPDVAPVFSTVSKVTKTTSTGSNGVPRTNANVGVSSRTSSRSSSGIRTSGSQISSPGSRIIS